VSAPPSSAALAGRLFALLGPDGVLSAPLGPAGPSLPLALPESEEELRELLRLAASDQLALVPCGLGSKLGWTAQPARADFLVSTRRLAGVVRHEPQDGTLCARAGTTMAELRARAAAGGHWLTPDVAAPERATLGGVISAGQSGLDRLRFGPSRHHVLGARVMLADGTLAKSGGQLVKNVAGFDLHRLYAGSHGALCVVLEVALRLFPAPERELLAAEGAGDTATALARARAALALPARITALWLARLDPPSRGARWALYARLGGKGEVVQAERNAITAVWPSAAWLEGDPARTELDALRDCSFEAGGATWLHGLCRPSRLEAALNALERRLEEAALPARLLIQPGEAVVDAGLSPEAAPGAVAGLVSSWRADLVPLGGRLELRNAPAAVLARVDPWGAVPEALEWMRRLRRALDAEGVLAAGRLAGGL